KRITLNRDLRSEGNEPTFLFCEKPNEKVEGPWEERRTMRVGLVGFSGSGKSTLFQLLTGATPDPGKVHAGQIGVATLGDPRLDFLAGLHRPKKVTPATVEFLDTPGLIPGTH